MQVPSRIRDYRVNVVLDAGFASGFERLPHRWYVVDENVWRLYSASVLAPLDPSRTIIQPINEQLKNLASVGPLYDRLADYPAKRNVALISIGGGILHDIAGFAASTLYRGVNYICVPTSLLAQADSCIGGKTSLNYGRYKNIIGTFYPPTEVYLYPPFLTTLEHQDFYSGLGEVIRLHIMGGPDGVRQLLDLLPAIRRRDIEALTAAVTKSLMVKIAYISEDEFDWNRRMLLNYGHDFGHGIETTSNFLVPHGQAVLLGAILANIAARNRGLLSRPFEMELRRTLLEPNIVIWPERDHLEPDAVIDAMKRDKKRTGDKLALVVIRDGYEMQRLDNFTPDEARTALREFMGTY
jgi:3-dehydroquinate synthase